MVKMGFKITSSSVFYWFANLWYNKKKQSKWIRTMVMVGRG